MNKSAHLKARHASEKKFRNIGYTAIMLAFAFLFFLLFSIFGKGIHGFHRTEIKLNIEFTESEVASENYAKLIRNSLDKIFPEVIETPDRRALYSLTASDAKFDIQNIVRADKNIVGTTQSVWLPASEAVDLYYKKKIADWKNKVNPKQAEFIKSLNDKDAISSNFNWTFFTSGDSQEPEVAGIAGAMVGSFFLIISCILVALPLAVLTAVFLEEFAPKNRLTDFIEININNLAAVPSIIYGLLGLAVYLNFLGMPRSAPIVGGLTLALMIIPVIIIATRSSLKSIPPSIRQGAMALGASPLQVVLHHTLPLAMPGIMTGTILGIARAMGETAPLLMIGMVAFIADIPSGFTSPATAMPVQIFLWSKNNQPGFVEKTAAAIMVLLVILILMNIIAVWIRKKYERRW